MYLYNECIMNILNDMNTLSCPSKDNSNTIELTAHTSCSWGLRLTLCYMFGIRAPTVFLIFLFFSQIPCQK